MLHTIRQIFDFFAPKVFGLQQPFSFSTSCLESSLELLAGANS